MDFTRRGFVLAGAAVLAAGGAHAQQQVSDPNFQPKVDAPAMAGKRLIIDQAHNNFHTASGRYAPFARLMAADGWRVGVNENPFGPGLGSADVLVIANALPPEGAQDAFTAEECLVVEQWVRGGGALWLIADHAPFGRASKRMGEVFGIDMGMGYVFAPSGESQLVFEKEALGGHAILAGRNDKERIQKVRSFTGQSLSVPTNGTALLNLDAKMREAPSASEMGGRAHPSVAGRCQGVAMEHGAGRLVAMGEAAMLSAQVIVHSNGQRSFAGMNVKGYDNQQFALNAGRWLGRVL